MYKYIYVIIQKNYIKTTFFFNYNFLSLVNNQMTHPLKLLNFQQTDHLLGLKMITNILFANRQQLN